MLAAALGAAGCGREERSPVADARLSCPAGVVARTPARETYAFTTGWVRLTLKPCPGTQPDSAAARLEVEGADHILAFTRGRPGGATAALLSGTDAPARERVQAFALPPAAGAAREVVLAPWAPAGRPTRLTALRLVAPRS